MSLAVEDWARILVPGTPEGGYNGYNGVLVRVTRVVGEDQFHVDALIPPERTTAGVHALRDFRIHPVNLEPTEPTEEELQAWLLCRIAG